MFIFRPLPSIARKRVRELGLSLRVWRLNNTKVTVKFQLLSLQVLVTKRLSIILKFSTSAQCHTDGHSLVYTLDRKDFAMNTIYSHNFARKDLS